MKTCSKCKQTKSLDNFSTDNSTKDKKFSWCKKCVSENDKKRKEKRNESTKKWLSENKDRQKIYNKEYRQKNKEKINKQNNERAKRKYKNDPNYRLRILLSCAIRRHLKEDKNDSIINMLPFTMEELKEYLNYSKDTIEHIDHIIPQFLYDNKDEYLEKCWNLRNLRLITAEENILKGGSLDWKLIEEYDIFDLLPEKVKKEAQASSFTSTENC